MPNNELENWLAAELNTVQQQVLQQVRGVSLCVIDKTNESTPPLKKLQGQEFALRFALRQVQKAPSDMLMKLQAEKDFNHRLSTGICGRQADWAAYAEAVSDTLTKVEKRITASKI